VILCAMNLKGHGNGNFHMCGRRYGSGNGWGSGMYSCVDGSAALNERMHARVWHEEWHGYWLYYFSSSTAARNKEVLVGVVLDDTESLLIYHECIMGET